MLFDFIFSKKSQEPNWPDTGSVIHAQISQPKRREYVEAKYLTYATVRLGQAFLDGNLPEIGQELQKFLVSKGYSKEKAFKTVWNLRHKHAQTMAEVLLETNSKMTQQFKPAKEVAEAKTAYIRVSLEDLN